MTKPRAARYIAAALGAALFCLPAAALAHGNEEHHAPGPQAPAAPPTPTEAERFAAINAAYLKDVKPIFKKSCFDCHSEMTAYPWYYAIPGVGWAIDRDIREGRKHLDMNADYPFKGHATPLKDLEAIEKHITEGSMPPWYYRLMHSGSAVEGKEKETVLRWARESRELLQKAP